MYTTHSSVLDDSFKQIDTCPLNYIIAVLNSPSRAGFAPSYLALFLYTSPREPNEEKPNTLVESTVLRLTVTLRLAADSSTSEKLMYYGDRNDEHVRVFSFQITGSVNRIYPIVTIHI